MGLLLLKSPVTATLILVHAIIAYFVVHYLRHHVSTTIFPKGSSPSCFPAKGVVTPNLLKSDLLYREYTLTELRPFDGKSKPHILTSVGHNIYDVSSAPHFYGPNGSYSALAGRDASPSLSSGRIQKLMSDRLQQFEQLAYYQGPEREALNGWIEFFNQRYPQVGTLVSAHTWAGSDQEEGKVGIIRGSIVDNLPIPPNH